MDKLYKENKALQERSLDEANDIAARSEMKHILKGQIPDEYALDYNKTFLQSIHKHKRDRIRKRQSGQLDKDDQCIYINARLSEEFDKDKLLSILIQNGYHSIEQLDSEDEMRQKLPNNNIYSAFILSIFLIVEVLTSGCIYDAKKIRNEAIDIKMLKYGVNDNNDKMTQYDNASLTDPNLDYLLNSAEMNLFQSEDLDEIGKSSKKITKRKEVKRRKKVDSEEETIDAIFNAEVVVLPGGISKVLPDGL
ncbi:hypothetical protein C1645_836025 [Glomus cerebriforme]|uniref:Uncharacterized protein n=1 Tax=Glomus cerebriforme TaxID=658196 RepID=A0A397S7S6_9GLOM|nr:hypothetical protein C1645_836025 [Glomus cerebriforme]